MAAGSGMRPVSLRHSGSAPAKVTVSTLCAALLLAGCVTAAPPPVGSLAVTVHLPAAAVAKVRPYCGKLRAGAIGAPILIAVLRAGGAKLPASADADAAIAAEIIQQVCR
jgi:hypothetical protein